MAGFSFQLRETRKEGRKNSSITALSLIQRHICGECFPHVYGKILNRLNQRKNENASIVATDGYVLLTLYI